MQLGELARLLQCQQQREIMKKIVLTLLVLLMGGLIFGQAVPQPAFRLLDGYLEKRTLDAEYGAKVGPWVLMGTGVALGAAAATTWFAGDDVARAFGTSPPSHETRLVASLGLGLGAVVLTGIGFALHQFPPTFDERAQYAAIYHETDAALQESLAASRLQSLSEKAQSTRLVNGWVNLGLSTVSLGFRSLDNQDKGRFWSEGLFNVSSWEAGAILGGALYLLIPSPEEFLYQEYLRVVGKTKG